MLFGRLPLLLGMAAALFGLTFDSTAALARSAELDALDEALPGKLVNDPSAIDWEVYGDRMDSTPIVDASIPGGGAALRFDVKNPGEFIYLSGTNVPLTEDVKRGETVTVGFYARTISARSSDGNGVMRVRFQQNVEPYPGFGEETLSIGQEWDWYEVSAKAERKLRKRDGIVALQFGRTRQIIEIGQTIVVTGADAIASETPTSIAAPPLLSVLPEQLDGLGNLINNPRQRLWNISTVGGAATPREDDTIWLGKATRFESTAASTNPADLHVTIPVEGAIAEGDILLLAIAARTELAQTPDGNAIVGIQMQDKNTLDDNFATNRFKVGPKWQLIRIKTRAPRNFDPGSAEMKLSFAGAKQTVDLGPVYILKAIQ